MKCRIAAVITELKDSKGMLESISEFSKTHHCNEVVLIYIVDIEFLNRFMTYVKIDEETAKEFSSIGSIILDKTERELQKVLPKTVSIRKLVLEGEFMETVLEYVEKEKPEAIFVSPDKLEIMKEITEELSETGKSYETVLKLCKSN